MKRPVESMSTLNTLAVLVQGGIAFSVGLKVVQEALKRVPLESWSSSTGLLSHGSSFGGTRGSSALAPVPPSNVAPVIALDRQRAENERRFKALESRLTQALSSLDLLDERYRLDLTQLREDVEATIRRTAHELGSQLRPAGHDEPGSAELEEKLRSEINEATSRSATEIACKFEDRLKAAGNSGTPAIAELRDRLLGQIEESARKIAEQQSRLEVVEKKSVDPAELLMQVEERLRAEIRNEISKAQLSAAQSGSGPAAGDLVRDIEDKLRAEIDEATHRSAAEIAHTFEDRLKAAGNAGAPALAGLRESLLGQIEESARKIAQQQSRLENVEKNAAVPTELLQQVEDRLRSEISKAQLSAVQPRSGPDVGDLVRDIEDKLRAEIDDATRRTARDITKKLEDRLATFTAPKASPEDAAQQEELRAQIEDAARKLAVQQMRLERIEKQRREEPPVQAMLMDVEDKLRAEMRTAIAQAPAGAVTQRDLNNLEDRLVKRIDAQQIDADGKVRSALIQAIEQKMNQRIGAAEDVINKQFDAIHTLHDRTVNTDRVLQDLVLRVSKLRPPEGAPGLPGNFTQRTPLPPAPVAPSPRPLAPPPVMESAVPSLSPDAAGADVGLEPVPGLPETTESAAPYAPAGAAVSAPTQEEPSAAARAQFIVDSPASWQPNKKKLEGGPLALIICAAVGVLLILGVPLAHYLGIGTTAQKAAMAAASAASDPGKATDTAALPVPPAVDPDLTLQDAEFDKANPRHIVGTVKNVSGNGYKDIVVTFTLKDANGLLAGNVFGKIKSIPGGKTGTFQTDPISAEVKIYGLREIAGALE